MSLMFEVIYLSVPWSCVECENLIILISAINQEVMLVFHHRFITNLAPSVYPVTVVLSFLQANETLTEFRSEL